jgi:hypothetical protein
MAVSKSLFTKKSMKVEPITYKKLRHIVFTQEEKIEKHELVWPTFESKKHMRFLQNRRQKRGIGLDTSEYTSMFT